MPNMPNRPREGRTSRGVRIDDDQWAELGEAAEAMDLDRGWIIRRLIAWYLGRAEEPPRPE